MALGEGRVPDLSPVMAERLARQRQREAIEREIRAEHLVEDAEISDASVAALRERAQAELAKHTGGGLQ